MRFQLFLMLILLPLGLHAQTNIFHDTGETKEKSKKSIVDLIGQGGGRSSRAAVSASEKPESKAEEPVQQPSSPSHPESKDADKVESVVEIEDDSHDEVAEPEVYFIVDDMPEFPGGEQALRRYIADNVQYPPMAKENDIQGTVYVRFVVDTDGSVTNVEIMRGVDPLLDREALRVVRNLPRWTPGRHKGKQVKVSHAVPIKFSLESNQSNK